MGYYRALEKVTKNNVVQGYKVLAPNSEIVYVDNKRIKGAIKSKQAIFLNLNIDSAGRLVMSDEHITSKLKIVAEAFKSITKDNYSPVKLMENYMSTYFNNGEYTLVSDFSATKIPCLHNNREYALASKNDVINCAKMIKANKDKKSSIQNVSNTQSNDNSEIYFTIKASEFYNYCILGEHQTKDKEKYLQSTCNQSFDNRLYLRIEKDYGIRVINSTDKKVNFIFIVDDDSFKFYTIKLENSIVNNVKINITDDFTCRFVNFGVDRCVVNSIVCPDSRILKLVPKVAYVKNIYIKKGLLARDYDTGALMFDTLNIEDYVYDFLHIGYLFGRELNITSDSSLGIECANIGYINNIDIKAKTASVNISASFFSENMTIRASEIKKVSITQSLYDKEDDYCDYSIHKLFTNYINKHVMKNELRALIDRLMTRELSLLNTESIIYKPGKINFIADKVEIKQLATDYTINQGRIINSLVNNSGEITTINSIVSTSFLSGRTSDNITLDSRGGIYISNNTSFVIHKIIAGKNLNFYADEAGIKFDKKTLKDFNLTILDSIKLQKRTNDSAAKRQYKLIIDALKELSEIKPINVMYGTDAYTRLTSAGVKVNILNLDSIGDKIKNRTLKEDMVGKSFFDILKQNLSETNFESDEVSIHAVPLIEISETYYKEFEINNKFDYNTQTINISRQYYWIYNILGKFSQITDIFKDASLNALHSNNYVSMLRYTNSKDKVRVGMLSIAKQTEKTVENIIFMLYDNVILRAVNIYDYYMISSGCLNDSIFKSLASISNLDEIDFDNIIIKQSLTLNTCEHELEKQITTSINKLVAIFLPVFISTQRKNIILPLTDNSVQMFSIRCNGYTASADNSLEIDTKHPVLNIANYKSINKIEPTLEKLKNTFDKQFSESIAYDVISNSKKYNDINMLELPAVECSTLHQIAMKYSNELANIWEGNDTYAVKITKEMLTDFIELPIFNLISNKVFKELIDNDYVGKTYTNSRMYDSDLKIVEYYISKHTSAINKAETEYTADTKYITYITSDNKEIYAVSTMSIVNLVNKLKSIIKNSRNKYNTEDYISYLGMIQDYELLSLLRKLSSGELDFIVRTYSNDYIGCLTEIYRSKHNFYDPYDKRKRAPLLRRTVICVDNVTGYMYLCVIAEIEYLEKKFEMTIPLSRIKDFRTASMLNAYLVKFDEYKKNKINNIILDVANGSMSIYELMLNQYNNNKNKCDYKRFIYTNMIAFNSHQTIFEKFSKGSKVENNTFNIMPRYNMGIIIKYINMGGLQIVKQIPQGFSIVNSYIGEGTSDKIDEYRSQSSEDIYYVIKEMILKSEFELKDLLDL